MTLHRFGIFDPDVSRKASALTSGSAARISSVRRFSLPARSAESRMADKGLEAVIGLSH